MNWQKANNILVLAKPNAKQSAVGEWVDSPYGKALTVFIKSAPQDGKANKELLKILAKFLAVPISNLVIKRGTASKYKLVDIN